MLDRSRPILQILVMVDLVVVAVDCSGFRDIRKQKFNILQRNQRKNTSIMLFLLDDEQHGDFFFFNVTNMQTCIELRKDLTDAIQISCKRPDEISAI